MKRGRSLVAALLLTFLLVELRVTVTRWRYAHGGAMMTLDFDRHTNAIVD
jgi:hypothetical protein